MVIAFNSKALRLLCENQRRAKAVLGSAKAEKLRHRLADLDSAANVLELVAGNPRPIETNPIGMQVDLCDGATVVFEAGHKNPNVDDHGGIQWKDVSRVKILEIKQS